MTNFILISKYSQPLMLDPESIRAKVLVSFCNDVGEYTNDNFWYVVLFGDDVLIVVVNAVLFFQGKDFIIRLRMVGRVLAVVVRSFLLLVHFFPLLLGACQIIVAVLLVVLIILVVSVVAILLAVVVMAAVPIAHCHGCCWHLLLWDYEGCNIWHLNVHKADGTNKRTLHCGNCFHCIGFGFLGGIDSCFWLVACNFYCSDSGVFCFLFASCCLSFPKGKSRRSLMFSVVVILVM
jgi:hypothetical protein